MNMDIVVPTYNGHYEFMRKFLATFVLNCEDKDDVTINLVISNNDNKLFCKFIDEYPTLKIKIMIFKVLVEKYNGIVIEEDNLLKSIEKFSYQSLKKLYGALETNNQQVCIFDSECLFIRKFKMRDYINENINRCIYCSRMIYNRVCDNTHAKYMQKNMIELMGTNDQNWYLEVYLWIFRRDILLELKEFLEKKCGKLSSIKKDFFIEYCYYLYCKMNISKYPEMEWIDTYTLLQNNMPRELFGQWCDKTHPWCMFEHIGLHLCNAKYDQIEIVRMMYDIIKLPIYRLAPNDKMNQLMLIACKMIKICVSEYCPKVYELTMKDIFNKKIGLFVSGLFHECDNVNTLLNFVHPLSFDVHYYLSTQDPSIYRSLINHSTTKSLIVDNSHHPFDVSRIKFLPKAKPDMVRNTIEMFYKKKVLMKYLNNYDIVVHTRPDLVSFDKKLIDLIYDMLTHYSDDILYTPIEYSSLGITDTFAMGSCKVMNHFLSTYDNIYNLIDKYIFNPEILTYFQMTTNNVKLYPIVWDYKINWHSNNLLRAWWRIETGLNLTPDVFEKYLELKISSYQTIEREFLYVKNKKYTLTNINSKHHLFVQEENITNCRCVTISQKKSTSFFITTHADILHRINIKLGADKDNMNHDGTGWNIFTVPDDSVVFGYGNSGSWAQFYIEKENNYYYIASYHSVNIKNKFGCFGRYIGIDNGRLVSDLPKCENTRWKITPVN
jgi:hypothetical protein